MITQEEQNKRNIESIKESLRKYLPYEDKKFKINVRDISIKERPYDIEDTKDSKIKGHTLGFPVFAELELFDKEKDKIIDSKKIKIFDLPVVTNNLSYLVDGVDYQIHSQLRRKPAIYTTIKADGTISSDLNTAKGLPFKVILLPEQKKFNFRIGTTNIPIYTLLKVLGASDKDIKKEFPKIFDEIRLDDKVILKNKKKLFSALNFGKKTDSETEMKTFFSKYFKRDMFDPRVNDLTIGIPAARITPQSILATMKKEIDINKKIIEEDNPDLLAFKSLFSLDDFIKERFDPESNAKKIYDSKLKNRLARHRKIDEIIRRDYLNDQLKSLISNYDLVEVPTQLNPINMLSGANKITILGSGGIRNERAVTLSNRDLNYSHLGFIDPLHTPEGHRIGTVLHATIGARKRDDNEIVQDFIDVKSGEAKTLSPIEIYDKRIAFPDQYENGKPLKSRITVVYKGKKATVGAKEVDYVLPSNEHMFDINSNLIPFLNTNYGARVLIADKMLEQALPLTDPDEPLIQTKFEDTSFEKLIGEQFSEKAPMSGIIKNVTENKIIIEDKVGKEHTIKLIKNIILNGDSTIDYVPRVKIGDKIKEGDIIAETQYTKDGTLALGKNLNVAYMPWHGYNFEDGIIVSESAASKLTSKHVYTKEIEIEAESIMDKEKFKARFPSVFNEDQLKKIDNIGMPIAKKIEKDDPLLLYMKKVQPTYEDKLFGLINKTFMREYKDRSIVWDKDIPGMVVGIMRRGKRIRLYITTEESLKVGDKLSGRHGNKGIVTKILEDNDMPKMEDGTSIDIILNPLGIPSRMNLGQIYETIVGKVADKIGEPIIVSNFDKENTFNQIKSLMKKYGVKDRETLINPDTGRPYPNPVLVGKQFIMKLNHQAEHKLDARYRAGYDSNFQPITGGERGGKKLDQLTMYALLAHGARENIREAVTTKSERNDEFWRALEMGLPLPPPKPTFAFNKFLNYLNVLGVDVVKNGNHLFLLPLTDKQIKSMSNGEIENAQTIRGKDFEPIKGGLFDVYKTGGLGGEKMTHIKLTERIPNPLFENTIKSLTNLTPQQYDGLVSGSLFLKRTGEFSDRKTATAVTGGKAFEKLLKNIDVKKEIKDLKRQAKFAQKDRLNTINKKLRYLLALNKYKLQPQEAYLIKNIPVIAPIFRPLYTAGGRLKISDLNVGYRDIILLNNSVKAAIGVPEQQKAEARKKLYDATKAVMGLGDPVGYRTFKGVLDIIAGTTQPKEGFFQRVLVKKIQEPSARAAITIEPHYGIDEIGLPIDIAWTLYKPFVMRRLVKSGYNPTDALKNVEERTEFARKILDIETKERPVILNRAPSLHKFSILAFYPKLIEEKSIKLNPLITHGFNADFDGDQMSVYLPITDKALSEAKRKLLASKNIFKPGENRIILAPANEALLGLYETSKTIEGKKKLKSILGDYWDGKSLIDSQNLNLILTNIATKNKDDFIKITQKLKDLGYQSATDSALSFGIDDFRPNKSLLKETIEQANKALAKEKGILIDSALSGARGSLDQIRQMKVAPKKIVDIFGREIDINMSYAEGMDTQSYFDSLFGARKGMIDKGESIREPGALAKNIINSTMDKIITQDVSSGEGIEMRTSDPSILNRYLSKGLKYERKTVYPKDTLLTPDIMNDIKRRKIKKIFVRSPLTDDTINGLASKDFGILPWGTRPDIGENIGIIAAHTITEPLSQATLRTFHKGGAEVEERGLAKIKKILEMPIQLKNKAVLSKIDGIVKEIKANPLGGRDITIGLEKHYLPGRLVPVVKKSEKIKKGDRLSTGIISPHDILETKGILPTRKFIANEIWKAVGKDSFDKRYAEVISRSITDKAVVLDPGSSEYQPGDTVSLNRIQREAKEKKIKFRPLLAGVSFFPLKSKDWIARLNSRELKKTIIEGSSQGWSADIHGTHPIPALVYGQEFGRGEDGRY